MKTDKEYVTDIKARREYLTENDFISEEDSEMYGAIALADIDKSKRLLGSLKYMPQGEKDRIRYILNFYESGENKGRTFRGVNGKNLLGLMGYIVSSKYREDVKSEINFKEMTNDKLSKSSKMIEKIQSARKNKKGAKN